MPSLTETVKTKYGQPDENQTTEGYDLLQQEVGIEGQRKNEGHKYNQNLHTHIHTHVGLQYCFMTQ